MTTCFGASVVPSNVKFAEVVVSSVAELYKTLFAAPTTSVALSAVPVKLPVTLPVNAPAKLVDVRVLVAKLNSSCGSVFAVVIVPDVLSVNTTLSLPEVAVVNVAPVFVNPAPSPKNEAAVIDPNPTISGEPEPIKSPPMNTLLPILTPPATFRAATDPTDVGLVVFVTFILLTEVKVLFGFANLTFSLNVTGPSNSESICFDTPPSTNNLSLTITSSATILNLFGSSPVIVGIGISNVVC